ncbi:MAG: sugar phosphate isomerase/epimerase family protein [Chloroflexota bacterium]
MARIPIALQVYSVRKEAAADLPGTLKAIKGAGYEGVEFAGYYERTAAELRKLIDDNGLVCAGTHTSLKTVEGDELPRTIEFNQTLGNKNLIVPGLPNERRGGPAVWRENAMLFNELAERVAQDGSGMRVGYHNHGHEFQAAGGEVPWDVFGKETRQDVILQMDLGNAMHGGADPVPYLRKFADKALTVHLKDHDPNNDKALLGEGKLNWDEVFAICEGSGKTEWYIVEQESYAYPPLECVRRCRENLKKMGR